MKNTLENIHVARYVEALETAVKELTILVETAHESERVRRLEEARDVFYTLLMNKMWDGMRGR